MADWSIMDCEWPADGSYDYDPFFGMNIFYQEKPPVAELYPPHAQQYVPRPQSPALRMLLAPPQQVPPQQAPLPQLVPPPQMLPPPPPAPAYTLPDYNPVPRGDNPREIRNKAEKQRRDKLNHSISELAAMVPPVVAANKKIDKTGVLRLTAHYLRAHQYVFGDSIWKTPHEFNPATAQALLSLLNGFLLTTTYRGLVVVVSQNVQQYLGYAELDLLGHNVFNIVHPDDHQKLRDNFTPQSHLLGPYGELLVPDDPEGKRKIANELASEKRRFVVRFKRHSQRSEPVQYVSCFIEGTLRKSDRACRGYSRNCHIVRRARARADNPCSSGNDVVFIGVVRPTSETFITEKSIESYRMEYRTRHSIDGEIMECDQRISLVTGYMTHEVSGANAMNFMHKDDVRWVIFALRDMYQQQSLVGESCYRLMTRNSQFIYLRTVGRLDVDEASRAVRSFVCLNTVVNEQDGKQLIKIMKRKYKLNVNNNDMRMVLDDDEFKEVSEDSGIPVEDPKDLERVILNLVTDLPTSRRPSQSDDSGGVADRDETSVLPLNIIPPRKEQIISSIDKIYSLINTFKSKPNNMSSEGKHLNLERERSTLRVPSPNASRPSSPSRTSLSNKATVMLRRKLEGLSPTVASEADIDEARSLSPYLEVSPMQGYYDSSSISVPVTPVRRQKAVIPQNIQTIIQAHYKIEDDPELMQTYVTQPTIYEVESELTQMETSPSCSGTKRPNDPTYCDHDTASKKLNNQPPEPQTEVGDDASLPEHVLRDALILDELFASTIEDLNFSLPAFVVPDAFIRDALIPDELLNSTVEDLVSTVNLPTLLIEEVDDIINEIESSSSPIDPTRLFPPEKLL